MRTAVVRARVDPELKNKATIIYNELGLSMSEAINLFLIQSIYAKGIPFNITYPSAEDQAWYGAAQYARDHDELASDEEVASLFGDK